MKLAIVIWMNMPSHHQCDYFQALSLLTDLQVNYTGKQDKRRQQLGWQLPKMQSFEKYKTHFIGQLFSVLKYRKATHIITGCGSASNIFIWLLCQLFRLNWCHLSEDLPEKQQRGFIKKSIIKYYYKSINTHSLCAFAIGNKAKRSFKSYGVKETKIHITNYSSSIHHHITSTRKHELPLKALVLGEVATLKGSDILIDVLTSFTQTLNVDFVGSIKNENANLAHDIKLLPNAKYLGIVPSNEVSLLWANYDFLIFPSRVDGWGMAVHEAISHHVPVICSSAAGCSEHLIGDDINGFIISPNKASLFNALERYIADPKRITVHSDNCLQQKLKFSPDATAKRFIENLSLYL